MKFKLFFFYLFFFWNDELMKTRGATMLADTINENFPFSAAVYSSKVCGGILITDTHVVTPAYCVNGSSNAHIYFELIEYYARGPNTQTFFSTNIFVHEEFKKIGENHYLNNIALVTLPTPAILSDKVRPGRLITIQEVQGLNGKTANLSGKILSQDMSLQDSIIVQIQYSDTCTWLFGNYFLSNQLLCIGFFTKPYYSSLGNVVSINEEIVGFTINTPICSEGYGGCSSKTLVLNVATYLEWIYQKANNYVEQFESQEFYDNPVLPTWKNPGDESNGTIQNKLNQLQDKCKDNQTKENQRFVQQLTEMTILLKRLNDIDEEELEIKHELNEKLYRNTIICKNISTAQHKLNLQLEDIRETLKSNSIKQNITELKFKEKLDAVVNIVQENTAEEKSRFNEIKKILSEQNNNNCMNKHTTQEVVQFDELLNDIYKKQIKPEIDKQFSQMKAAIDKDISTAQHDLLNEVEGKCKMPIPKDNGTNLKFQEKLDDIVNTIHKNTLEENVKLNNIKKTLDEQKNSIKEIDLRIKRDLDEKFDQIKSNLKNISTTQQKSLQTQLNDIEKTCTTYASKESEAHLKLQKKLDDLENKIQKNNLAESLLLKESQKILGDEINEIKLKLDNHTNQINNFLDNRKNETKSLNEKIDAILKSVGGNPASN